ncbi:MAG: transcription antitermination factor NusB [Pseudomonadota bacterium]
MLENTNPINKHVARFLAILSLYSYKMQDLKTIKSISSNIKEAYNNKDIFDLGVKVDDILELHKVDERLLEQLILLYTNNIKDIHQTIKNNLIEKYSLAKLDKVIGSILELATIELLYCADIPAKIIIDEYVSLTKTFYENSEAGFVNKVIDTLARSIRPTEIE